MPSLGTVQPIENSPPGIHTMPAGAGLGTGVWLGRVGANGDTPATAAAGALTNADDTSVPGCASDLAVINDKEAKRTMARKSDPLELPPFLLRITSCLEPAVDFTLMIGWLASLAASASCKLLSLRTGTGIASALHSFPVGGSGVRVSQRKASSKRSNACIFQPRSLAIDTNMGAR